MAEKGERMLSAKARKGCLDRSGYVFICIAGKKQIFSRLQARFPHNKCHQRAQLGVQNRDFEETVPQTRSRPRSSLCKDVPAVKFVK
jgi:hypothetical protein